MDAYQSSAPDAGGDSIATEAPECFLSVPVRKIPDHFPQAVSSHPAQQRSRAGLQQASQIAGKSWRVFNAIQGSEV